MNRSELDKLSDQLSMASTKLSNEGKFSQDIDNLINEYEYGGIDDGFEEDPAVLKKFVGKAKDVLDRYKNKKLPIQEVINKKKYPVIDLDRKKNASKAKPKRKIVKKCKCK